MAFENTNRGTISKNTKKTQDTHPDIKGSINVDGLDYWISGWLKKNNQDGSSFYSLSVQPKEATREPQPTRQAQRELDDPRTSRGGSAAALDDEIPFGPEFR